MENNFLKRIMIYITVYIGTIIFIFFSSYIILIDDYKELDNNQNTKNIKIIINQLTTRINHMQNIINDYSKWDDTYNFTKNSNKEYIFENFREGSNTLKDLNLDLMIITDLKQEVLFSTYINKKTNNHEIESKLLQKIKNLHIASSLVKVKDKIFYVIKEDILKSDFSGQSNGYMIIGKLINEKSLEGLKKVFTNIDISFESFSSNDTETFLVKNTVKIKTIQKGHLNINYVQFFDINHNHIFTIVTNNIRVILQKGEESICILNIFLSIFILILFVIFYKNKKTAERYKLILESKIASNTKELISQNQQLEKLANIDFLTNIKNRRSFFIESNKLLDVAILDDKDFSVLMIDIDKFKNINDQYGHKTGDEVLKYCCEIINNLIIENSIFGRIGGEEFVIIFEDTDINQAEQYAECIRENIEKNSLFVGEKEIKFTISIGLTQRKNQESLDEILQVADEHLYKAKITGRNRVIRDKKRE